jgi:hypothetical protein
MAEYLPPEVTALLGLVDTHMRWKNANQPPRGHDRFHPSAFGKCLRLMQYQRFEEHGLIKGQPETPEPFLIRIWGNGHSMHDRWREYFEDIGVLKGYWQCDNPACCAYEDNGYINPDALEEMKADPAEYLRRRRWYGKGELQGAFKPEQCVCGWNRFTYHEIDVEDKEMNIYGHADMILDFSNFDPARYSGVQCSFLPEYLPTEPIVVDMKTINHFDYQNVAKGEAHDYYDIQLKLYANILKCAYGVLIYENKNNQRCCAFKIDPASDTVFPELVRQAKAMQEMFAVIDEDGNVHHLLPPPRPIHKESKDCTYCGYREICHASPIWDDPDLAQKRKDFYGNLLSDH